MINVFSLSRWKLESVLLKGLRGIYYQGSEEGKPKPLFDSHHRPALSGNFIAINK